MAAVLAVSVCRIKTLARRFTIFGMNTCPINPDSALLASVVRLVAHAEALGLRAHAVLYADAALAECPMAVTCMPASAMVLSTMTHSMRRAACCRPG